MNPGPHSLLAIDQLSSRSGIPSLRRAFSGRHPTARRQRLASVPSDGLRPVELLGKSALDRSLVAFVTRQVLSYGIPWQPDAGGCERIAGLAHPDRRMASVKMHPLRDLCGRSTTFIRATDGKVHDVNMLGEMMPKAVA